MAEAEIVSVEVGKGAGDVLPGFKMTELGSLPEEWKLTTVSALVSNGTLLIRNGFPEGKHNDSGRGVPHLRPFNVASDGRVDLTQIKYVEDVPGRAPTPECGDIIFNNTNSEELVGKTAYFDLDGLFTISNHLTRIRVAEPTQVDSLWLAFYLQYLWSNGIFRALCRRHVNQASISLARLGSVILPLPPLEEQRAIARVLRTVQRAREATEKVIAATRALKKSLMNSLFTYGYGSLTSLGFKEVITNDLGTFPMDWPFRQLGELCDEGSASILTGPFGSALHASDYDAEGTPAVMPRDMTDGRISCAQIARVRNSKVERLSRYLLAFGDVVMARRGELGRRAVISREQAGWLCGTGSLRLRFDMNRVSPWFISFYLETPGVVSWLEGEARGSTMLNLSATIVRRLPVPIPELPEQQKISAALEAVDQKISAEEQFRTSIDSLFGTLLRELMNGITRLGSSNLSSTQQADGTRL